jgi:hypothetical protein
MLLLGHFYSPVPKKELLSLEVLTSYSGLSWIHHWGPSFFPASQTNKAQETSGPGWKG